MLHAACWKCRTQKIAKNLPCGHNRTTLSGYIFATKACIDNRKKTWLNSNIPPRPHNIANFGPLTAEMRSGVWGTPANFNRFRVLAVTARHSSSGRQPNFAALNRGRHLYSAWWSSRWAFAHILVYMCFYLLFLDYTIECQHYITPKFC